VATRFPVQLYTTPECASCDAGRQFLQQRGIPYLERRVVSEEDALALQRLLGWRSVPSVSIGSQALRGFSSVEWGGYLDAAGYPRESRLPRGWQAPAVTALAAPAARPQPVPSEAPGATAPPVPPPATPAVEDTTAPRPSIRF
jgi:glutaredoxin